MVGGGGGVGVGSVVGGGVGRVQVGSVVGGGGGVGVASVVGGGVGGVWVGSVVGGGGVQVESVVGGGVSKSAIKITLRDPFGRHASVWLFHFAYKTCTNRYSKGGV